MPADHEPVDSPAEQHFAEFLEGVERGEAADFEALCRQQPGLATELRRIHRRWQAMTHAFTALSKTGPGAAVSAADSASLSALMARLAANRQRWQRYALGTEIARGGMGQVVMAWDEELRRDVALKIHRQDGDGRLQRRFVEEAQIAAQLDHPGIVPVYELGLDGDGRPFFVMKLVRGRDLGELLTLLHTGSEGWSRTRALHVLLRVCEAMAYAHDKGVVHRDLKPQNIMVGRFGETYVMDWGLARVVSARDTSTPESAPNLDTVRADIAGENAGSPLLTRTGDVVGTPAYMAPEQANGGADAGAPAVDVYAIGAILYHLLAGHAPFTANAGVATSDQILAAVRHGPPPSVPASVPAELRAICDNAMARQPQDRYPTMLALADDLRAFLELRVVSAYRTGGLAELGKWIARNRALATSSLLLLVVLLVGSAVTTQLWLAAEDSQRHANANASRLAKELQRGEYRNARLALRLENSSLSASALWRQHLEASMPRATHWALVENAMRDPVLDSRSFPTDGLVAFAPAVGALVVPDDQGQLHLLDPSRLTTRRVLGSPGARIGALAVSTSAPTAVVGTASGDVVIWDLERGVERRHLHAHAAAVTSAAVLGDGFVTGDLRGAVLRWPDVAGQPQPLLQRSDRIHRLQVDPTTGALAVGSDTGEVELLDLDAGARQPFRVGDRPVSALAFSNDGRQLWVGNGERICVIDRDTNTIVRRLPTSNGTCRDLMSLADGTWIAAGWWRIDHLAADGARLEPFTLHGELRLTVAAGGSLIAGVSKGVVSLVDTTQRDRRRLLGSGSVALSGDGASALTFHDGLNVLDVVSGQSRRPGLPTRGGWLRADSTGSRAAIAHDGKAWICDLDTGATREFAGTDDGGFGDTCVFAPDGSEFALIVGAEKVERRRAADGGLLWQHIFGGKRLLRLHWSPDGSRLAMAARGSATATVLTPDLLTYPSLDLAAFSTPAAA
ncbi:MAG: serine/threonine-protein kinase [Planctomycetota bacterium]